MSNYDEKDLKFFCYSGFTDVHILPLAIKLIFWGGGGVGWGGGGGKPVFPRKSFKEVSFEIMNLRL